MVMMTAGIKIMMLLLEGDESQDNSDGEGSRESQKSNMRMREEGREKEEIHLKGK